MAVGVGFLLNSTSSVMSWSCVARCRFWFFCCCVRVLFRGGRRAELPLIELAVGVVAEGEGVDDMSIASPFCILDMAKTKAVAIGKFQISIGAT